MMREMIAGGTDVNAVEDDWQQRTSLSYSAESGRVACVETLIELGANVNAAGWDGSTPLLLASSCGHVEVMRMLIEPGSECPWKRLRG